MVSLFDQSNRNAGALENYAVPLEQPQKQQRQLQPQQQQDNHQWQAPAWPVKAWFSLKELDSTPEGFEAYKWLAYNAHICKVSQPRRLKCHSSSHPRIALKYKIPQLYQLKTQKTNSSKQQSVSAQRQQCRPPISPISSDYLECSDSPDFVSGSLAETSPREPHFENISDLVQQLATPVATPTSDVATPVSITEEQAKKQGQKEAAKRMREQVAQEIRAQTWMQLDDIRPQQPSPITQAEFLDVLAKCMEDNDKISDADVFAPRRARTSILTSHVATINMNKDEILVPPPSTNMKAPQWKHAVDNKYYLHNGALFFKSTRRPVVEVERWYNVLCEAHVDANGNHHSRDKTYARAIGNALSKSLITKCISICPHPTCRENQKSRKRQVDTLSKRKAAEDAGHAPSAKRSRQ